MRFALLLPPAAHARQVEQQFDLPAHVTNMWDNAINHTQFTQFPPHGDDGHLLFSKLPQVWQPVVADFLRGQGFDFRG